MDKEFITYEQAMALKELGFDEPCFGRFYYKESYPMLNPKSEETELVFEFGQYLKQTKVTILAPTFSQAFRWFREKHKLYPEIGLHDREDKETWRFTISILGYYELAYNQNVGKEPYHKTYEEAESACIDKLIEITKTKVNE